MTVLPPPGDAVRVSRFLADHPQWSACWDKKRGLWHVAEDDPDSDLYAESPDADIVLGYIAAHASRSAIAVGIGDHGAAARTQSTAGH